MDDKRKHIRVSYEKQVELLAEGRTFEGKSIDISRSGVQIVVNVPVSHSAIQRMTFKLPVESETLDIPCRIVRKEDHSHNESSVLGIEFDYQTEAQMALIENYIRDVKNIQIAEDHESYEMRIIPRISCSITDVSCDKSDLAIVSIDNISTDGCLISYEGALKTGEEITVNLALPGETRRIAAPGTIAYVVNNYSKGVNKAGVFFSGLSEMESARLQNFIVQSASQFAFKTMQDRRLEKTIGDEYQICGREKIGALFNLLKKEDEPINVLFDNSLSMLELKLSHVSLRSGTFRAVIHGDANGVAPERGRNGYCSFSLRGSNYYFQCELLSEDTGRCVFSFPDLLYQSEQRSHERKLMNKGVAVSLELEGSPLGTLRGTLVNVSRRGFLCNVALQPWQKMLIRSGQAVQYFFDKDMGLDTFGEIRHFYEDPSGGGGATLQIGVEAGIRRAKYRFKRFSPARWNRRPLFAKRPHAINFSDLVPDVVSYANKDGKEIVALLNCTRKNVAAPVVILPPAFGKKKEVLSPLVTTLLSNFSLLGKDIITIRYDGVNRPGESYTDDMCPRRGYEMLHYRISQGLDDLRSTIDFVYDNPYFRPEKVIIAAFSMSALDARKLALADGRIHYLINVMGVTCARSSFRNITGGLDIIGNARIGLRNGLSGVLGHILDLDTVANDLIQNKYAYIADARYDMAMIDIPVSWIYGKYDKWISEREVRDIMSVFAEGDREVIEIPTGHNLRSSEDAVKTFKIITRLIYRRLYGKNIKPVDPCRERMVELITHERERLSKQEEIDAAAYWKKYLIGNEKNSSGYDFYKNYEEFRKFVALECSMINLRNGEVFADMGCGTGLLTERILLNAISRKINLSGSSLKLVDLVPEALDKCREKMERLQSMHGSLVPRDVEYANINLEPNRLLPVKRFIENPELDVNYLRNRIEGLKNTTIDRILELDSEMLSAIMRGAAVTKNVVSYLEKSVAAEDRDAILEFNIAARYLNGDLETQDCAAGSASINGNLALDYMKGDPDGVAFHSLNFGDRSRVLTTGFAGDSFDKIAASLLIGYLFNADEAIHEFYRLLKPGGQVLVSSMLPDSDFSLIFTNYINKVQNLELDDVDIKNREKNLAAARDMLNETASLFELEEEGYFKFFTGSELAGMLKQAGFRDIRIKTAIGKPPLAVIVTGIK